MIFLDKNCLKFLQNFLKFIINFVVNLLYVLKSFRTDDSNMTRSLNHVMENKLILAYLKLLIYLWKCWQVDFNFQATIMINSPQFIIQVYGFDVT